jgi:hypothetical protein
MSWKNQINPETPVWHGLVDYIDGRIQELTAICIMPESTTESIRAAQAGIVELTRIVLIPKMLASETQIRNQAGNRKEY